MIQFSELRISANKRKLYVGCEVENFDIYQDVYVDSIYVEYYKNRLVNGESSENAICIYQDDGNHNRSVYATLDVTQLTEEFGTDTFDGGLFYVYVSCDMTSSHSIASADCGWDNLTTVGIILDWERIYRLGTRFIREVSDKCGKCITSDGFIDFILRWEALRLAVETCDYDNIDNIWDGLLGNLPAAKMGCGCS